MGWDCSRRLLRRRCCRCSGLLRRGSALLLRRRCSRFRLRRCSLSLRLCSGLSSVSSLLRRRRRRRLCG